MRTRDRVLRFARDAWPVLLLGAALCILVAALATAGGVDELSRGAATAAWGLGLLGSMAGLLSGTGCNGST